MVSNQSLDVNNILRCGAPVNFTEYDNLQGIANRKNHPIFPEPEVSVIKQKY